MSERGESSGLLELQKPVVGLSIVAGKSSCGGGEGKTGASRPLAEDSDV